MNRQLRARIVLEEARALGIDIDDLICAATGNTKPITVAAWIDEIAPAFGSATARTYRPYWRILVASVTAPWPTSRPWTSAPSSTPPRNGPRPTGPTRPAGHPERAASPRSAPSTPEPSTPDT